MFHAKLSIALSLLAVPSALARNLNQVAPACSGDVCYQCSGGASAPILNGSACTCSDGTTCQVVSGGAGGPVGPVGPVVGPVVGPGGGSEGSADCPQRYVFGRIALAAYQTGPTHLFAYSHASTVRQGTGREWQPMWRRGFDRLLRGPVRNGRQGVLRGQGWRRDSGVQLLRRRLMTKDLVVDATHVSPQLLVASFSSCPST